MEIVMPLYDVVSQVGGNAICSCVTLKDAQGTAAILRRGHVPCVVNRRWIDPRGVTHVEVVGAETFRATSNSPKGGEFSDSGFSPQWHLMPSETDLFEPCRICGWVPRAYRSKSYAAIGSLNTICQPCMDAAYDA